MSWLSWRMHRHITKQMRRRLILPSSREFQSDLSHPRSHVRSVDLAFPPEAASLPAFSLSPLSFSPTVINACIHRFRQLVAQTNAALFSFWPDDTFSVERSPKKKSRRKEGKKAISDWLSGDRMLCLAFLPSLRSNITSAMSDVWLWLCIGGEYEQACFTLH